MRYDYFANFYEKAGDRRPRYCSPLGLHGRPSENDGFIEDPKSDQGYLDYIKTDASEMDLQELTLPGFVSEVIDVLDSGIEFERITIEAREIDIIDDEGTVPPCGFFIHGTFVEFGNTEPFSPVWFIDGDPYEANENTRRFRVPMKKLKDYFEAGIDDAANLATRTFFGLRDLDGNPQILHALAAIKDYKEGKAHVVKR